MLEEKKTKELSAFEPGKTIEQKIVKNDNSFYDGGSNKNPDTKWTQDWRGKTLGLTIAASILIAAAIPSGMAISGYFNPKSMELPNITKTDKQLIKEGISSAKDRAIIWQLEQMENQGQWDNEKYVPDARKKAEKKAKKDIQAKKDSLKKEYGNTYKDELDKHMSNQGWKNDTEWKNSLLSQKYKEMELSRFSSPNKMFRIQKKSTSLPNAPKYISVENSTTENKIYIENSHPNNDKVEVYDLTAEKFMDFFVKYYQPILFNDSLFKFIPTIGGESETADLTAGSIVTNVEEIFQTTGFYDELSDANGFTPAAYNYNGIQSAPNIDLTTPIANIALYNLLEIDNNKDIVSMPHTPNNPININKIIEDSFTDFSSKDKIGDLKKSDIEKMTDSQIDKFETNLRASLLGEKIIDDTNKRKVSTITEVRTEKLEWNDAQKKFIYGIPSNEKYIVYLAEDGLHMTGIQSQGKTLVENFLNKRNSVDSIANSLFDNGLETSFKSFIDSEFENVVLLLWIKSLTSDEKTKIFTEIFGDEITQPEVSENFVKSFSHGVKTKIIEKRKEAEEFYSSNWKIFDYNGFKNEDYYSKIAKFSFANKEINEWAIEPPTLIRTVNRISTRRDYE